MAESTAISWTDSTFNAWIGCTKVAPECEHCYAMADFDTRRGVAKWGPNGTRILTTEDTWRKPLLWNKKFSTLRNGYQHRVFCSSLSDVFEDWSGVVLTNSGKTVYACHACGWINRRSEFCDRCHSSRNVSPATFSDIRRNLFTQVIDKTPHLTWQILTKRPENVVRMLQDVDELTGPIKRSNVWIGFSAGCQKTFDQMIPHMAKIPSSMCSVKFLSCEPMIGSIDILKHADSIDWVICGGESKFGCRPMNTEWAIRLHGQCSMSGIPFFMKQLGGHPDKRTDIDTFPESLRERSFP